MKKLTIHEKAIINAEGNMSSSHCKPVICIDTGEVYTSVTDAVEHANCHYTTMISHLKGNLRTCKGKHYCYLSNATASLDAIVTRLREASEMEAKAKVYDAMMAEQEAARQAEEKHRAAIAKAEANVQRRNEVRDNLYQKYLAAIGECEKAEAELAALKGKGETEVA